MSSPPKLTELLCLWHRHHHQQQQQLQCRERNATEEARDKQTESNRGQLVHLDRYTAAIHHRLTTRSSPAVKLEEIINNYRSISTKKTPTSEKSLFLLDLHLPRARAELGSSGPCDLHATPLSSRM